MKAHGKGDYEEEEDNEEFSKRLHYLHHHDDVDTKSGQTTDK